MAPVAKDFDKIIKDGRERRKNEALASRIFSRDRRRSAPPKLKAGAGPSLASRVGVGKVSQRPIIPGRRTSFPNGNVNGEWTHDLHHTVTAAGGRRGQKAAAGMTTAPAMSLGKRITPPGQAFARKAAARKARAVADAMDIDDVSSGGGGGGIGRGRGGKAMAVARSQVNVVPAAQGISIRGLAGPYAVLGQNFAPGTTAADVESAMTPIGGEMVSCKVVKTQPFLMMEMVFVSREGAERVIQTFDNKTADGRILKVFPKFPGYNSGPQASSIVNDLQQALMNGSGSNSNNNNNNGNSGSGRNIHGGSDLFSDKIAMAKRAGRGGRRGGRN